jgi:holo-[acyl-carrier protein] synthase
MIVGMGIDIVRSSRIERIHARFGARFARRILTSDEYAEWYSRGQSPAFLAKRFAVKEAAAKALRTGFRAGLRYRHIGVAHDANGAPILCFAGRAAERIAALGVNRPHVSISDEQGLAVACVILETDSGDSPASGTRYRSRPDA